MFILGFADSVYDFVVPSQTRKTTRNLFQNVPERSVFDFHQFDSIQNDKSCVSMARVENVGESNKIKMSLIIFRTMRSLRKIFLVIDISLSIFICYCSFAKSFPYRESNRK